MWHGFYTARGRLKLENVSLNPEQTKKVSHSNMKKRKTLFLKESEIY